MEILILEKFKYQIAVCWQWDQIGQFNQLNQEPVPKFRPV